ncbi:MAG TPA: hypothetical protein VIC05_02785 [Solirubrobacteraceae bacterium]
MFTRREPREVYRVYGEDELFAEDQPSFDSDPMAAPAEPVAAHDPDSVFSPEYTAIPEPFMQAAATETFAPGHAQPHRAPAGDELRQAPEAWEQPRPLAAEDPYGSLPPRSPLIATQRSSSSRTIGIAALAVIIGLIVGLLAVSALRSGASSHAPVASTQTQPHTPQVATPPAGVAHPTAAKAQAPHHAAPAARAKAHPRVRTRARTTHSVYRPAAAARQHLGRAPAPTRTVAPAPSQAPPAPVVAPSAAISAPAVRYIPPSPSSGGMEFGFEH